HRKVPKVEARPVCDVQSAGNAAPQCGIVECAPDRLRRRGIGDTSETLDFERRPVPAEIEADTFPTQVCGYPLQTIYRGQATLLRAPVNAARPCCPEKIPSADRRYFLRF